MKNLQLLHSDEKFGTLRSIDQVYLENSAKALDVYERYKKGEADYIELTRTLREIFNPHLK